MPLNDHIPFKARLGKGNRILIPQLLRWQYKMEPGEKLEVIVNLLNVAGTEEVFLRKMGQDGRLTIPKLIMEILEEKAERKLSGCILEVVIGPCTQQEGPASSPGGPEKEVLDKISDIRKSLHQGSF